MMADDTKVLISLIRKITPMVIAQQIAGVQPMTGNLSSVFSNYLTVMQGDASDAKAFPISNAIYGRFLRLNNRRKTQTNHHFKLAGYPKVKIEYQSGMKEWCNEQFGPDGYVIVYNTWATFDTCWFVDEDDATLFRLRWA